MPSRNIELNLSLSIPTSAAVRTWPSGKVGQSGGSSDEEIDQGLDQTCIFMFLCFVGACQQFFGWQELDLRQNYVYVFLSFQCFFCIDKALAVQI